MPPPASAAAPRAATHGTEYIFKVPVIGTHGVGKTTLLLQMVRYSSDVAAHPEMTDVPPFDGEAAAPTVGVDFVAALLPEFKPNMHVRLQFWDTAGTEQFAAVAPVALRNAAAALVVFDATDQGSLEAARDRWLPLVVHDYGVPPPCVFLVGNMTDKITDAVPPVDMSVVDAIAEEYTGIQVVDCSAAQGTNVGAVLGALADVLTAPYDNVPQTSEAPAFAPAPKRPAEAQEKDAPRAAAAPSSAPAPVAAKPHATARAPTPPPPSSSAFSPMNDDGDDPQDDTDSSDAVRKPSAAAARATAAAPPPATSSGATGKPGGGTAREPQGGTRAVDVGGAAAAGDADDASYETSSVDSDDSSAPRLRREKKARRKHFEEARASRRDGGKGKGGCPC